MGYPPSFGRPDVSCRQADRILKGWNIFLIVEHFSHCGTFFSLHVEHFSHCGKKLGYVMQAGRQDPQGGTFFSLWNIVLIVEHFSHCGTFLSLWKKARIPGE
jgi:hypothetical protein